jgi:hypothetical protein
LTLFSMPPPHAITLSLAFIEPPAPYFQLHFRDGITPFRRRHYISYAMNMMAFRRQLSKRATLIHYAIDAEILKRAALYCASHWLFHYAIDYADIIADSHFHIDYAIDIDAIFISCWILILRHFRLIFIFRLPLRHYLIIAIFIIDYIIDDIDTLILISFHYAIIDITHYAMPLLTLRYYDYHFIDISIILISYSYWYY